MVKFELVREGKKYVFHFFALGVSQRKDLTFHDESTRATEINFNDT